MTGQRARLTLASLAAIAASSCILITDAATRLAYDLEREAGRLRSSQATVRVFEHRPVGWPAGCTADFDLMIGAGSDIAVRCVDADHPPTSGVHYTTTYHRRFVKVPRALSVSRRNNANIRVTLRKQGDEVIVDMIDTIG
jgi:hypothetical protein